MLLSLIRKLIVTEYKFRIHDRHPIYILQSHIPNYVRRGVSQWHKLIIRCQKFQYTLILYSTLSYVVTLKDTNTVLIQFHPPFIPNECVTMLLHIPNFLVQIYKYSYLKGIMNIQYRIGFSHDDLSIWISIDRGTEPSTANVHSWLYSNHTGSFGIIAT